MTANAVSQPVAGRPGQGDPEAIRREMHRMWGSVAGAWDQAADYVEARGADVSAKMLQVAAPLPGDRVLELACGVGGPGLAAAALVGPAGQAVLSDIAPEMTALAAARARALGLGNVRTRELDLEAIDEPDCSYDVVLCREGLMFAVDPARAAREIYRILRPGGRVALAVWGPRSRNPWLHLVFDAVSAQLGVPVPPPGVPGPFALDDPQRLAALLEQAQLTDVLVVEHPVPLHAASFEEWWGRTSTLAGPLANRLAVLPHATKQALHERLRDAVRAYQTPTGLEFPGVSLLASARRPNRDGQAS